MPRPQFDIVIAGGGSAGCVLAARLSEEADCSVCLVEAGPDYGPFAEGGWPADILDARALAFSHAWERDSDDRSQLRARILGGCSAHNACAVLHGPPGDYEWGHGWSFERLEPYLQRAQGELRTRRFADDEVAPSHRALIETAQRLGLPLLDDPNEPRAGVFHFPVNAVGAVRWNTAFAYLDRARERRNLTILADTLVDRVRPERGCVFTDRGELHADRIVLAAGAYGSPAILLRSGFGPGLEHDLPVGEGLVDHPGVGVGWEPSELLHELTAPYAARYGLTMGQSLVKTRTSSCPDEAFDVHLFGAIDPGKDELGDPTGRYELSSAVFLVAPRSRGSIRLRSPDAGAPPVIEHGFLSSGADVAPLAEGLELMREIAATEPLRDFVSRETRPGPDADLEAYVREAVRGYFHPVATCSIGSVVDGECRLLGLDNLFVADGSVVPVIPRANTNLTVVAVAEAVSELLSR